LQKELSKDEFITKRRESKANRTLVWLMARQLNLAIPSWVDAINTTGDHDGK